MARINTTIVDVMEAIATRLRTALSLNESTCYWLIVDRENDIPPPTSGQTFITISPDGGEFDERLFEGGVTDQLTATTGISVAIHTTLQLDAGGRDKQVLTHDTKGIFKLMTDVLAALTGHDPVVNIGGDVAVRELLRPTGYSAPRRTLNDRWTRLTVYFAVSFDWDLTP